MSSGIRKRGSSYAVSVTVNGKRQTGTAATHAEALALQAQLRAMLFAAPAVATPKDAACWTLREATTQCEQTVWKGTRNESNSIQNANSALQFFGNETMLDAITTSWTDGYIARLKQLGNSNATINRKLAALSRIMSFARERDKMSKAPKLRRQREIGGRIRFLTQDEERTSLSTLAGWEYDCQAEAVCVLFDSGLRTGELWRLTDKDVNLAERTITVWINKADKPRTIPMTTRVYEILSRRLESTQPGQPIFPHNNRWLRTAWERMKHEMGLSDDRQFVPHALRHTFASRLLQRGVELSKVQELLGHKTIEVTRRYGHFRPHDLREAIKVLEAC